MAGRIACFFALFSGLVPCQSRVLLFWSVDSGKKTQETIKANVRSVQDLGIEHDVILAHYRGSPKDWDHAWYKKHVVQSITGKGYKFHFLQQAYKEGDWEQRYEFVWALDSDIDLSKADVLQFLDLARETNSGIVGPTFVTQHGVPHSPSGVLQEHAASVIRREGHSPTRDDAGRHRLSGPQRIQMPDPGCDFRHTDFVELTAPLLKSDVLKSILLDCHGCIHEKSDWGLDMMWCKYVSERSGQGCALVDKTPVTHLDWGLAPIGQEFYMALHSVQAHYAQFWSKKQVLDCQQRSGGLVEEDDDEEDPATSKRSVRKQKKHKEMVSGDSEEGVNASVNQSAQASKPVKRSNTTRSVSKSSSEEVGQADVDEDEDLEESVDSNGLPSKNSTAKTNSTAAKVATKSRVKNSTSTKKANEKSEEQEDEDNDDDDDDDDDEEGTVDKLKQGSNSTAASQKQSNTSHTQVKSDEAKQAKVKAEAEDDDSDDEDEDEEDDLEPKSTLNSTQAKAAPSTPESDIFKVKAMGPGAAQAGGVIIRNGEPAQRGVSKHLGESTVMAAAGPSRDSKDAFGQQTEAEDEDLDAEDPEASPAKTRTGAVSVKIDASGRLQKVGQDETVEFQEGRQAELSSFEEAEQRLRDDIEELRKLEQELEGIRPRQGPTEAEDRKTTEKKRSAKKHTKQPQAVSLIDLDEDHSEDSEPSQDAQSVQIQALAAGARQVAMQAAQEVQDSLGGSMTEEQLEDARTAALQSVQTAIEEQVQSQEVQKNAKAEQFVSDLLKGKSDSTAHEASLSHRVRELEAKLLEVKRRASKDHQVEELKVSTLASRVANQKTQEDRQSEDQLLMARAKQITELKARLEWDQQRMQSEMQDELELRNKVKQLEGQMRRSSASLVEEPHHKKAHKVAKKKAEAEATGPDMAKDTVEAPKPGKSTKEAKADAAKTAKAAATKAATEAKAATAATAGKQRDAKLSKESSKEAEPRGSTKTAKSGKHAMHAHRAHAH